MKFEYERFEYEHLLITNENDKDDDDNPLGWREEDDEIYYYK